MMESNQVLTAGSPNYPAHMAKALGNKTPSQLYWKGNLGLFDGDCIGFCGSRKASEKGIGTAEDCANQFAKSGWVIVSGYASGVDMATHRAALDAGGSTIIVLPEGIENFRIKREIKDVWDWTRVLVVSQFEPQASWQAFRAMQRNAVIIGLSRSVIVIEAGEKGGTMNTGLTCLKLGIPLFAALYENMPAVAPGNQLLLEKGASLLRKNKATGRAHVDAIIHGLKQPLKAPVSGPTQLRLA